MILFAIKKSFFDLWDNLLAVLLLNLAWLICLAAPITALSFFDRYPWLSIPLLLVGVLLVFIYSGVASRYAQDVSDYKTPQIANIGRYIREQAAISTLFAILTIGHTFLIIIAGPFYNALNNILGLAALAFLFWVSLLWLLCAQFIFPIRGRLDRKFGKIIKKSLIIVLDNLPFAIICLIGLLFITIVSLFTAFLLPGPMGLLIWIHVMFKLRLYKYDYLEESSDANRHHIPWKALLTEDYERVGPRTLRGMIFPWKE